MMRFRSLGRTPGSVIVGFLEKLGGNREKRRPWNKFNFEAIEDGGIERGSSGLKGSSGLHSIWAARASGFVLLPCNRSHAQTL